MKTGKVNYFVHYFVAIVAARGVAAGHSRIYKKILILFLWQQLRDLSPIPAQRKPKSLSDGIFSFKEASWEIGRLITK